MNAIKRQHNSRQQSGKKILLGSIVLALSLPLSACSGLPTNGDVQVVERVAQREGGVVLDPKGPAKGATAEQVIAGFLRAASVGLTDNFQAARQFLTADMARKWDPLSAVRIYPDTQSYSSSQTPAGAYRVSVPTIGSVDADGIYTPASKESQLTNEFSLIRNPDGEWRIAVLDDGMMMSRALFNSLYIEAPLYFPSHIGKDLVADVRWYPRQGLVSSIARGIAKGPAKWISPAVRVVMPPDVLVSGSQVRSSDSVAVVDLSANATALPQETIMILQAQYRHSFSAAGVAQDVIITASGVQISGESQIDLQTYALQDSPLVGIQDGSVVRISRNKQQILPVMPSEIIKSLGLRDLTLAYGESLSFGSALDDSGSTLYRLDFFQKTVQSLLKGTQLIAPSIDKFGWIWSGEQQSRGDLLAIEVKSGATVQVKVPELAGVKVKFVKISREGARAVIAYERDGAIMLAAAALTRSSSGQPQALGQLLHFDQWLADVADLAWIDETNLAVLGHSTAQSTDALLLVQIGGPSETLNVLNDPVGLTAGHGKNSIVLADKSDVLYEYDSGAWRRFTAGVKDPAMAG